METVMIGFTMLFPAVAVLLVLGVMFYACTRFACNCWSMFSAKKHPMSERRKQPDRRSHSISILGQNT